MTEPRDLVARVRNGEGRPRGIRFARGVASGPFSLGKRGAWRISGDGVEDMHAYMQFDGDQVSVLGLLPENPPTLEGRPVGEQWTVVPSPGVVHIGNLRIVVDTMEDDDHLLEPAPSGVQPVVPGAGRAATSERDVVTVLAPHPLAQMQTGIDAPGPVDGVLRGDATEVMTLPKIAQLEPHLDLPSTAIEPRPNGKSNGALVHAEPADDIEIDLSDDPERRHVDLADDSERGHEKPAGRVEVPTRVVDIKAMYPQGRLAPNSVGMTGSVPPSEPEPAAKPARRGLAGSFRNASLPKRIVFVLLPLTFAAFIFRTAAQQAARTRAAAAHLSAPAPSAPASAKPKSAEEGPPPSAAMGTRVAPTASDAPVAPPAPDPETARTGPTVRSRERQAADLVSSGDFAGATKIYQELAAAHPDRAAFREAARILQEKSAQGEKEARHPEPK
jgi:hypothetical protein